MFRLLAYLTLIVHLAFVIFVVFGGLLALRWPTSAWFHLPAVSWGAGVELAGWSCPLTPLENWLRTLGGGTAYGASFVEHHLFGVIYPSGLTRPIQIALGAAVLGINLIVYRVALQHHAGQK